MHSIRNTSLPVQNKFTRHGVVLDRHRKPKNKLILDEGVPDEQHPRMPSATELPDNLKMCRKLTM